MEPKGFHRKLTAILSADVAGYSRLMQDNEAATVETIQYYKQVFSDLIKKHHGRLIDSPGDNLLAEFASVVDAVQCAVEVQMELQARNAYLPENRKMQFRIGVNLGDVIEEESRIYGDGVNIAARLENIANPGGLCISKTAFDQIETKLPLVYEYIGEQAVKNIAKPVAAYRVVLDPRVTEKKADEGLLKRAGRTPLFYSFAAVLTLILVVAAVWQFTLKPGPAPAVKADQPKTASPPSDIPSIAVLPFINLSGNSEQEYFGNGIAEDIITDLSKLSGLIVIAGSTSSTYKDQTAKVQMIGRDLGVRYLLNGSFRKSGDQMRINAQLIDTSNGQHLWAERYDGRMDNLFALQDNITRRIISALALKLTPGEEKAVADKGTNNIQAYEEYLKGWQSYRLLTKHGFAAAKVHLEKAVELDPEFCRAYAALAILYWRTGQFAGLQQGLGLRDINSVFVATLKSHNLLQKAMKKPTALAYGLMSQTYLYLFLHDKALAAIEKAIAMDPNDPDLYAWMSNILWFMGKNSEAIEFAKKAQLLDPNNPALYLFQLGSAYLPGGDLEESLYLLEWSRMLNQELGPAALRQSIVYALQGRNEDARETFKIFLKLRPTGAPLSLKALMPAFPFADRKASDHIANAMMKAGVPDNRTDYCRLSRSNLLNGHEIKSLLAGRRITGISTSTGEPFLCEWTENGEFKFTRGVSSYNGKYWVEEEVLFAQFDKLYNSLPIRSTIFKNPGGTKEDKNEYYFLLNLGIIIPFTFAE